MGKLGAILAVAGIAISIIKPMLPMIRGLGKMIGEFLRPIADVIMMLLAPLLSLLRPILITFKALMAPFKQAAMAGIAASQKLIGQGMQLGMDTPEGKLLVAEGFEGSLSAASLMFSGFIETIFAPIADLLGLSDQWSDAMDKWQDSALGGVYRAIMLSETVDAFSGVLGNLREAAVEALDIIDNQMALLRATVDTFTIENFTEQISTINAIVDASVALMLGNIENLEEAVKEINLPIETVIGTLKAGIDPLSEFANGTQSIIDTLTDASKLQVAWAEALRLGETIEAGKPGFWKKLWGSINEPAKDLADFFPSFGRGWKNVEKSWKSASDGMITEFKSKWEGTIPESMKGGLNDMVAMMDTYMGKSLIPDSLFKGLKHMYNQINLSFDPNTGAIITTVDKGLTSMELSMNNSLNSFKNYGKSLQEIAELAENAAEEALDSSRDAGGGGGSSNNPWGPWVPWSLNGSHGRSRSRIGTPRGRELYGV